jgi:hypothetical protein
MERGPSSIEKRRRQAEALKRLKDASRAKNSKRGREFEWGDTSSEDADDVQQEAGIFDEDFTAMGDSEEEAPRKPRAKRVQREKERDTPEGFEDPEEDIGAFIVSSGDELSDEEEVAEEPMFHAALLMQQHHMDDEAWRHPGIGLLKLCNEPDEAWRSWPREVVFDWYCRFLALAVRFQGVPDFLRTHNKSADARCYAFCVRAWEAPMLQARDTLVASQAWYNNDEIVVPVRSFPVLTVRASKGGFGGIRCEICNRKHHQASKTVKLSRATQGYNAAELWDNQTCRHGVSEAGWEESIPRVSSLPTAEGADSDSDEAADVTAASNAAITWKAGRFCAFRLLLYSRAIHWKLMALQDLAELIPHSPLKASEPTLESLVSLFQSGAWVETVTRLQHSFESLLAAARGSYATSSSREEAAEDLLEGEGFSEDRVRHGVDIGLATYRTSLPAGLDCSLEDGGSEPAVRRASASAPAGASASSGAKGRRLRRVGGDESDSSSSD